MTILPSSIYRKSVCIIYKLENTQLLVLLLVKTQLLVLYYMYILYDATKILGQESFDPLTLRFFFKPKVLMAVIAPWRG